MTLPVLIVGGRQEFKPGVDLLLVEPEANSITIKQVRELEKFLQRKPYREPVKTVVITRADKLTLAAQQALLKTLEEPPAHSQIILLSPTENQLLATVVSRCLVKRLPDTPAGPVRLEKPAAAAYASTTVARDFVLSQLRYWQQELRRRPETANIKLIKALNRALLALNTNVNPKLTLDVLSLSY